MGQLILQLSRRRSVALAKATYDFIITRMTTGAKSKDAH
jgi:hypothetical protein